MRDSDEPRKPARRPRKAAQIGATAEPKQAPQRAEAPSGEREASQAELDREKQQIEQARQAYMRSQMLDIYVVQADAASGNWIGEPSPTGFRASAWDWSRKEDTGTEHYRTYVHHDVDQQEERAIILQWVFH
jgi:hypothetical protein